MAAPMELQAGASPGVLSMRRKRFLVLNPKSTEQPSLPMVVVEHWAAGLGK